MYIGSWKGDLECDRNARVTLKDGTTHCGPWKDGIPVGDWWTCHKMVTHHSKRIADRKKQEGVKKKQALADDSDSDYPVLVLKTLKTTAKEPKDQEIIDLLSSDSEISLGDGDISSLEDDPPNSPSQITATTTAASARNALADDPINSAVSQITSITTAAGIATSQAKMPPTTIAASRSRAPVQHDLVFPPYAPNTEPEVYHHRFRFVRILVDSTRLQMELQAYGSMNNGKNLLELAIQKDKEEQMGVFSFTPKDAARLKNKQLMLDFEFAIGYGNDEKITLPLNEFRTSTIQTLSQGIQRPYVTEYKLVLRQPVFSKDYVFLDLSD